MIDSIIHDPEKRTEESLKHAKAMLKNYRGMVSDLQTYIENFDEVEESLRFDEITHIDK